MGIENLEAYARGGENVMLIGAHGVGKTKIVEGVFNKVFGEYYKHWRYFSASTIDPWVDFIGVPKPKQREDGREVCGIVPPENFVGDEEVYAIFIDELNRGQDKTQNGLMELIQFRRINGREFPNLRCIWAAINPDDEDGTYSVNRLDPAQEDRFTIQIELPNELSRSYMVGRYGKDMFEVVNDWWKPLKNKISPRRMDAMCEGYLKGYDLKDYVRGSVPVKNLESRLRAVHHLAEVSALVESGNEAIAAYFTMEKINSLSAIFKSHDDISRKVYPALSDEVASYLKGFVSSSVEKEMSKSMIERLEKQKERDLSAGQIGFIRFSDNLRLVDGPDTTSLGVFIQRFTAAFKDADWNTVGNYLDLAFGVHESVNTINTHHWKRLIKSKDSAIIVDFIKVLSVALVETKIMSLGAVIFYKKMMGSGDIVRDLGVNKNVAKKVISYHIGKIKSTPELNSLFENEGAVIFNEK